jgi:hypothetical protein
MSVSVRLVYKIPVFPRLYEQVLVCYGRSGLCISRCIFLSLFGRLENIFCEMYLDKCCREEKRLETHSTKWREQMIGREISLPLSGMKGNNGIRNSFNIISSK